MRLYQEQADQITKHFNADMANIFGVGFVPKTPFNDFMRIQVDVSAADDIGNAKYDFHSDLCECDFYSYDDDDVEIVYAVRKAGE